MEIKIRTKLASRLRELRRKYKYTQQRLSELSDVDYKPVKGDGVNL